MNNEVLILSGNIGVGKTSTALIWSKNKNGVLIETKQFDELITKEEFPNLTDAEKEKLISMMITHMTFQYLRDGRAVVIDSVKSPKQIEMLRNELFRMRGLTIKAVRLVCDLEENQKRDQTRNQGAEPNEEVARLKKEMDSYDWPALVHQIDTTNMSVIELIEEIDKIQ